MNDSRIVIIMGGFENNQIPNFGFQSGMSGRGVVRSVERGSSRVDRGL